MSAVPITDLYFEYEAKYRSVEDEIITTVLTFQNLPVTLRTTKFNIKKFCLVITLHL